MKRTPNKALKRFLQNKIAIVSAIIIVLLFLLSILGYVVSPDKSVNGNTQYISLKLKPPGFSCKYLSKNKQSDFNFPALFFGKDDANNSIPIDDSVYRSDVNLFYKKYNQAYWEQSPSSEYTIIKKINCLGTDALGRDVLSRLILGTRISMTVGIIAVIISIFIGCVLGMLSGYYGGWIDKVILWIINIFWAIPTVLLAMALLVGFSGVSKYQILIVFLAVGLTMWVDTARMVRGQFLQLKQLSFVEAIKAMGFNDTRIIVKHIFPNTIPVLIIVTASNFAAAILIESGLSYLGLGVQPPTPSWGSMMREYFSYLGTDLSYLPLFPGLCIMIAVFSFYGLGNGLRDAMDIKNVAD